ncbi:hypothetical protein BV898_05506 [Hypsibius exemplaris]|uniref:N-acetyltransferase domain-containing protein n=1 Tax=Hypsibius exemplaris TaxID=2072580 RepID=A0A1W0WZ27_HYPEX|nr:hypothetical protein BV898_05506 [Hypsibius exemplaris]
MPEVLEVYRSAPLSDRAEYPEERLATMFKNANIVITAWDGDRLIGVARSVADLGYCCYVSDLAVRKEYQNGGVGKELLRLTKEAAGDQSNMVLLSADEAMNYYPKIGMKKIENGFIVKRKL